MRTDGKQRIIGALMGDLTLDPGTRTKYGLFFKAVQSHFPLVEVYDARLRGFDRLWNAALTFHPNQEFWRERFYKNIPAFKKRSQNLAKRIMQMQHQADLILQVGVLFDSSWGDIQIPSLVYTDYTALLSSQKPAAGRSPFTQEELRQWIDLERRVFQRAGHICTRSLFVRDSIVQDYQIPAERVSVVGGGVNFPQVPVPVQHIQTDQPTALFIGKEFYRKGGDLLLRAFAEVRQKIPNARLLFLTEGKIPPHLPLEGVEWIKPTWDRKFIQSLYRQSQIFVLPSRLETWGDVLLEAMSCGLPCVGVSGQAMEELIIDGTTGMIVSPEDEKSLAEAMLRLFNNPALRMELGQSAYQRTQKEFTWECVAERIAQVVSESNGFRRRG